MTWMSAPALSEATANLCYGMAAAISPQVNLSYVDFGPGFPAISCKLLGDVRL